MSNITDWQIRNIGNKGTLDVASNGTVISYNGKSKKRPNQTWRVAPQTPAGTWFFRPVPQNQSLAPSTGNIQPGSFVELSSSAGPIVLSVHPMLAGCVTVAFKSQPDFVFSIASAPLANDRNAFPVVLSAFDVTDANQTWVILRPGQQAWSRTESGSAPLKVVFGNIGDGGHGSGAEDHYELGAPDDGEGGGASA